MRQPVVAVSLDASVTAILTNGSEFRFQTVPAGCERVAQSAACSSGTLHYRAANRFSGRLTLNSESRVITPDSSRALLIQ